MKNQPKVNQTQKHSNSQGEHIVCEGKLVLIKENKLPKINDLVYHGNNGYTIIKDEKHLKFALDVHDDQTYVPVKPIIISETENLKKGDWYYTHLGNLYKDTGKFMPEEGEEDSPQFTTSQYKKVLALPENFSNKHLQSIVDGKMKNGDKVLIKCVFCVSYQTKAPDIEWDRIYLNKRKHITLFYTKGIDF